MSEPVFCEKCRWYNPRTRPPFPAVGTCCHPSQLREHQGPKGRHVYSIGNIYERNGNNDCGDYKRRGLFIGILMWFARFFP